MEAKTLGLKKGARIKVQVTEVLSSISFLVNFEGNLFRITNESRVSLQKDQTLYLTVIGENPLQLRFESYRPDQIDRFA